MSRFKTAAPKLAELTGLPLFQKMAETDQALPMAVGIDQIAVAAAWAKHGSPDPETRTKVRRLLGLLSRSGRYRAALAADDAMRHNENGRPIEPVAAGHKNYARRSLDVRAYLKEQAARQNESAAVASE